MITERKKIAIDYIKSWFLIDIVSVIPFDLIAEYLLSKNMTLDNPAEQNHNYNQSIRMAKVSKLYKLIKITRMIRLLKLRRKKKEIGSKIKNMM